MSNQLLSSKVVIEEEALAVLPIQGATQSDCLMLSITERGPIAGYTLINSFTQYKNVYGGYTPNGYGAIAAQNYFDMGGTNLWMSRAVHFTDLTNLATKTSASATGTISTAAYPAQPATVTAANAAPYALVSGQTLVGSTNLGGPYTATFTATAAIATGSNASTFALTNGWTALFAIDGDPTTTVTFQTAEFANIAAATTAEVCAVINAAVLAAGVPAFAADDGSGHVQLRSTTQGTGSSVNVLSGTALTALGLAVASHAGTGNVANIADVTAAEVASVVAAAFTNTAGSVVGGFPVIKTVATGSSATLQVTSGTANSAIGFPLTLASGAAAGTSTTLDLSAKTDGIYGNVTTTAITAPSSGTLGSFNLLVYKLGALVESWPNLNMVIGSASYAPSVINDANTGSNYIALTDAHAPVSAPYSSPAIGVYAMSGGSDGLTSLADNDFVGNAAGPTGLRAFDQNNAGRVLIVPGEATPAVHNAMLTYCSAIRFGSMFAVLDPPMGMTAAQIDAYVTTTAQLLNSTDDGAIYWPNIYVNNPDSAVFGTGASILVPPSAAIAGRFATNDAAPGGIYEAPAGVAYGRLDVATGLETAEVGDVTKRDIIYPDCINPIVGLAGLPIHIDGCKTLLPTSPFPTIGERRGMIYIEQSLLTGVTPFKHRMIKARTLRDLGASISDFLLIQTNNGAFASDDPTQAYTVDTSSGINTPVDAQQLLMNSAISIATAKPGEFIMLKVSQNTALLQQQIAAATSGNS